MVAEVESEIERLAELCWRAHSELSWEWPTDATQPDHWRAVARAVIADRATHPPVTDGPTLVEIARERDEALNRVDVAMRLAEVLRAERDDAQRLLADANAEHDALRDLLTDAETERDMYRARNADLESGTDDVLVALRAERDEALAEARRTAAECDDAVADARRERDAAHARAVAAESRSAAESEHLFGAGKAFERAQVVAYMRANWENWPVPGRPARDFTAEIERGEHIAEIAAERDAAEQRASEQRPRAKEAEDVCVGLRSRVADLMRERDAQRATRRSVLAQAFAAAMLAEHREDNLPWDEVMRRAFDAADVFLATEKESK